MNTQQNEQFFFNDQHYDMSRFTDIPGSHQTNSRFYSVNSPAGNESSGADGFPGSPTMENDTSKMQLRSQVMREEREGEFLKWNKLRIFIGTWNVNGQLLYDDRIMCNQFLACDSIPPDIYAIGFQELDLSKEAYLFNDPNGKEEHWVNLCKNSLHPGVSYCLVDCVRLIGMMLVVYVKRDIVNDVVKIDNCTVGTGLLGKMGNKGGVGIRFEYNNTTVCFVNCHLAAHQDQIDRRNADYREILARMKFVRYDCDIGDHDQIYWFGDMNYRVDMLTGPEVKQSLQAKNYDFVLEYDQLNIQKKEGKTFRDYQEGSIKYMPTYKYNTGTDEWDSSEKERAPAWCDRILWKDNCHTKSKDGKVIRQLLYRSHPSLKTSDHKPVSAVFESSFKAIDKVREKEVMDDIMKKLDKEENDYLPQVEIDRTDIDFGTVTVRDNPLSALKLRNVGKTPVYFFFANKLRDQHFCKPWLLVTPTHGRIGLDETFEIAFEIAFELSFHIDPELQTRLDTGEEKLHDTLVLRLKGGRDIFISVTAEFQPMLIDLF